LKLDPRRVLVTLSTAGAIVLAAPTAGYAQGMPVAAPSSQIELRQDNSDNVTDDEVAFIRTAVSDAATEVEAGELARDRAGDSVVRQFAERLIRENQTMMDDAADVAEKVGVDATQAPTDDDELALIDDLLDAEGNDFDETYLRAFVQDQRVTLQDYLTARDSLDGDVSDYADRHVGRLSDQLRAAIELAQRLGIEIEES
jgi:putative membrane protein